MYFPLSHRIGVSIPTTIASYYGEKLEADFSDNFETERITVVNSCPKINQIVPALPYIFLRFSQRINPERVLDSIIFCTKDEQKKKNPKPYCAAKLITNYEQITDDNVLHQYNSSLEYRDYILVAQATKPFPNDTIIGIVLQNVPSEEGPLLSDINQPFSLSVTTAPKLNL